MCVVSGELPSIWLSCNPRFMSTKLVCTCFDFMEPQLQNLEGVGETCIVDMEGMGERCIVDISRPRGSVSNPLFVRTSSENL